MNNKLLMLLALLLCGQFAMAQFLDVEFRDQTVTMEVKQNGFFVRGYDEDATGVSNGKLFQWSSEVTESRFILQSTDDNNWYKIYHPASGRYVTTSDVSHNGTVTLAYDADNGDSNQEFKFVEQAEDDMYKIHSRHSQGGFALVLSIPKGNTSNGVSLRLTKNVNAGVEGHQKFRLTNKSATPFNFGALLNNSTIIGKDLHITNKATNGQLGEVNGVPRQLEVPVYSAVGVFTFEDGSDDGKWWTADKRWFHIRSLSAGTYLTVSGSGSGSAVTLQERGPNLNNANQQFRLIPAPANSGWYKLRSRLGNLVLEMRSDGSLVVGTPTLNVPTHTRQKFAFNLDIPDDRNIKYALVGKQHSDYLTDRGELTETGIVPVKRTRIPDPASYWHFIPTVSGYFFIQNALTLQLLYGHNHPDLFGKVGERRVNDVINADLYLWEVIPRDDHFIIRSKYRSETANTSLLGTPPLSEDIVFQNITQANTRWNFYRAPVEETQGVPTDMDEIADNPIPDPGCFVNFGTGFKRGLAERVGLPADEVYFPFIQDALAYETGLSGGALLDYMQRIDLNSEDHRAYLALAVRNYVGDDLSFRDPSEWKTSDHTAIDVYKNRIRNNRIDYGNRVQAAWADFLVLTNANGTAVTSNLLEQLDVNDFVWPAKYDMDETKAEWYKGYITAAANNSVEYKLLVDGLSVGIGTVAGIGTGVAMNSILSSIGPGIIASLDKALTAALLQEGSTVASFSGLATQQAFMQTLINVGGGVVSIVMVATQVLVDQVVNTIEIQELKSDVDNVTDWTQQQIDFYGTLTGNNLVQKLFLLEDLDFVIGVPVNNEVLVGVPLFREYLYQQNDNFYFDPTYDITCKSTSVLLDANGQGQLTTNIADLITETGSFCGGPFTYDFSQSTFDCSDVGQRFVTVTASNSKISKNCQLQVTVSDMDDPVARCKDAIIVLNSTGQGGIGVNDIDDGSTDDCFIVSKTVSGISLGALDCTDLGTYPVTLTVSDASNHSSSCTATVSVVDEFVPSVVCKPATIQLDATGAAYMDAQEVLSTFYDNCDIVSWKLDGGVDGVTYGCSDVGVHTVNLTIADASGNNASCSASVTVKDEIVPDAQCQAYTVYLNEEGTGMVMTHNIDNGSADACGIQTYEIIGANTATGAMLFNCEDVGSTNLTLRVTDTNGNSSDCMAAISVQDLVLPKVLCLDQTLTFNGEDHFQLATEDLLISSDNCGIASIDLSQTLFSCEDLGQSITVYATVIDENGNENNCSSQVTLEGLPCGFNQMPDGVNCSNGNSVDYDVPSSIWTLTSTGCYYSPNSPIELAYTSTEFCGNGTMTAQLHSISGGTGWAGITLRESDAPGAKYVQISLNGGNFMRREVRTNTNGPISIQQTPAFNKKWLRLVRNGNQVIAYLSANGQSWQQTMVVNIQMSTCIEAGLMLTNASPSGTVMAQFGQVDVHSQVNNGLVAPAAATTTHAYPDFSQQVQVYPNPSAGRVQVELSADWGEQVSLSLVDQMGRLLQQRDVSALDQRVHELDLSALPSGIYQLMLRNAQGQKQVKRIVLQKP